MTSQERLLIEEIEFWQEMIKGRQHPGGNDPALERMCHALALAEHRLRMLAAPGAGKPSPDLRTPWPQEMPLEKGPERKH